jgi:hypothetical protein
MPKIRFKVNFEEKEYTLDNCPEEISHVNYMVFPILDKEVLVYAPYDIHGFKSIRLKEQLENIQEAYEKEDLENTSLENIFNQLDAEYRENIIDWIPFDDDFWETYFKDDPHEAARATYFGNIQNWNDEYIRFNGYGNLETTHRVDYDLYDTEILEAWLMQILE